jgi:hypothetical protein
MSTDKTYIFFHIANTTSHHRLLTYLQFRPCTSAEHLASPLQTLFGFFDHIINDLLGGFDILSISFACTAESGARTYIDHGGYISHEPHPTLHGFLGMFLEFLVMRDLSFGCKFLAALSASVQHNVRIRDLHFLLPAPPGLDVIRLPDS